MTIGEDMILFGRTVMGKPIKITPTFALLRCVEIAAGEVEYCTIRLHAEVLVGEEMATVFTYTIDEESGETRTAKGLKGLHPWIKERQRCIDRLARLSKMALDAGVAEREVAAREQVAATLARFASGVLDGLGLSPEQLARAPQVVREQLLLMAGEQVAA